MPISTARGGPVSAGFVRSLLGPSMGVICCSVTPPQMFWRVLFLGQGWSREEGVLWA